MQTIQRIFFLSLLLTLLLGQAPLHAQQQSDEPLAILSMQAVTSQSKPNTFASTTQKIWPKPQSKSKILQKPPTKMWPHDCNGCPKVASTWCCLTKRSIQRLCNGRTLQLCVFVCCTTTSQLLSRQLQRLLALVVATRTHPHRSHRPTSWLCFAVSLFTRQSDQSQCSNTRLDAWRHGCLWRIAARRQIRP